MFKNRCSAPPLDVPHSRLVKTKLSIDELGDLKSILSYAVKPKLGKFRSVPKSYCLDHYFLFPEELDIGPHSFSLNEFYKNFSCFVRFREPKLSYKELSGVDSGQSSSIEIITKYIEGMVLGKSAEPPNKIIDEMRYFGASFYRYCSRKLAKPLGRLGLVNKGSDKELQCERLSRLFIYVERACLILRGWRNIRFLLNEIPDSFLNDMRLEYRLVSEYCSYVLRDQLFLYLDMMEHCESAASHRKKRILAMLRLEQWYSDRLGFDWPLHSDSAEEWENHICNKKKLEQRISSYLDLRLQRRTVFAFQRHLGPMLAAAFAGAWAVIISLLVGVQLVVKDDLFSSRAFIFLFFLTFAYVLKDRIKEIGRATFQDGIFIRLPRSSDRMMFRVPGTLQQSVEVGRIVEDCKFVSADSLPLDVLGTLQRFGSLSSTVPLGRRVLRYSRKYKLNSRNISIIHKHIKRFHEISFLKMTPFKRYLDTQSVVAKTLNGDGRIVDVEVARINKLDLVVRVCSELSSSRCVQPYLGHFRLTFGHEGLLRIEKLGELDS